MDTEFYSTQAVDRAIERLRDKCGNDEMAFALNWALRLLAEIPAADVIPVEWIEAQVDKGKWDELVQRWREHENSSQTVP